MNERAYPLPRPSSGEDPRFTFGLSYEVGQVLESHGFPPVRGADHVELMQALFRFIYASEALPEPRETAPLVDVPTVDERKPTEIVFGDGRYGDPELDGLACILCHEEFAVGQATAPAGVVDGGPQVFAHRLCLEILHAPMPGYATRMTRCGIPLIAENGARTALYLTDVTCTTCQEELAAEPADFAAADAALAEDKAAELEGQEEIAAIQARFTASFAEQVEAVIEGWAPEVRAAVAAAVEADRSALPELAAAVVDGSTLRAEADTVIEEWVPKAVSPLPTPQRLWAHSGPCIYCAHGPACVTCDLTQGPYWGKGAPGQEHPGPVCSRCSEECKRREIVADPYYSGDYVTMFGDDQ